MLREKLGIVFGGNKTNGWLSRQNCSLSELYLKSLFKYCTALWCCRDSSWLSVATSEISQNYESEKIHGGCHVKEDCIENIRFPLNLSKCVIICFWELEWGQRVGWETKHDIKWRFQWKIRTSGNVEHCLLRLTVTFVWPKTISTSSSNTTEDGWQ